MNGCRVWDFTRSDLADDLFTADRRRLRGRLRRDPAAGPARPGGPSFARVDTVSGAAARQR
ncbi:MAG: hypothetical protein M0C28_37470 [Candidatus Moduliflexus flocculans]|nr:hypothetical protein [Candidatus Moduliflexus flocculans]